MKRTAVILGLVLFFIFFIAGNIALSAKQKCCIAGTYKGSNKDIPSLTCSSPGEGEFKIVIEQDAKCGSKIWGTIYPSDGGDPMNFEGTVTAGPGKKECSIDCLAKSATESVKFKAILFVFGGQWKSKAGKYSHSNGCEGTFEIEQI